MPNQYDMSTRPCQGIDITTYCSCGVNYVIGNLSLLLSPSCSSRGVFRRRSVRRSRMRCLRARLVTSHPGGAGPRSGGKRTALRGARCIGRHARRFKKRGPVSEKCRSGAPRGEHPDRKGCAAPRKRGIAASHAATVCAFRRSAPLIFPRGNYPSLGAQAPARTSKLSEN
jgi:hypothetical protein